MSSMVRSRTDECYRDEQDGEEQDGKEQDKDEQDGTERSRTVVLGTEQRFKRNRRPRPPILVSLRT
jgi:hypothetical protein